MEGVERVEDEDEDEAAEARRPRVCCGRGDVCALADTAVEVPCGSTEAALAAALDLSFAVALNAGPPTPVRDVAALAHAAVLTLPLSSEGTGLRPTSNELCVG